MPEAFSDLPTFLSFMQALFRRKGPLEVLETLAKFTAPVLEKTFLREFSRASYYNAYDRAKGVLLEFKLVEYAMDREEKTICLTPKGRRFLDLKRAMEDVLYERDEKGAVHYPLG